MSDDLIIDLGAATERDVEAMAAVNRPVTRLGDPEDDPASELVRLTQELGKIQHQLTLLSLRLREKR